MSKAVATRILYSLSIFTCAGASVSEDTQCAGAAGERVDGNQLMQRSHLKTHSVLKESCASLQLTGLDVSHCDGLSPGESCEVSCPAGQVGSSVRFFCFQSLADAGLPPAALRAPLCFPGETGYQQGMKMVLRWVGTEGCLSCPEIGKRCSVVGDVTDPADTRCTVFKLDLSNMLIRLDLSNESTVDMCLDMNKGPNPGLWYCSNTSQHQDFELSPSGVWPGMHDLCVTSERGTMCFTQVGLPDPFFETAPDTTVLQPALDALHAGDNETFLQQSLAVQACRARLETGLPDDFWLWLNGQSRELHQALFATFPVHPGQVKLFSALVESFGRDKVQELGLSSLLVAVSWVNRGKDINDTVRFLNPSFEQNDNTFLAGEEDRIRQEIIEQGRHIRLQSNECRNLNYDCCNGGAGHTSWTFKWPRDPSPSVGGWAHWLVDKAVEHPGELWQDPRELPWTMGAYIFPSPIAECEWVHDKLIKGQPMEEAKWYKYDSSFHLSVCEAGDPRFHHDSLPGMAVYGGVCGRMAILEARKSGCMGMASVTKGEPGHNAGFKFKSRFAVWTTLNVVSSVPELSYLSLRPTGVETPDDSCLSCPSGNGACALEPMNSSACTKFWFDEEEGIIKNTHTGKCINIAKGPEPSMYNCNSKSDRQMTAVTEEGLLSITSSRGNLRFLRWPVVADVAEESRCLKCPGKRALCEFAVAGSQDCTLWGYDEETKLLHKSDNGRCLHMNSGPFPGVDGCNSGTSRQQATLDNSTNQFRLWSSGRGMLLLRQPGGGALPPPSLRFLFQGFHEIDCTLSKCHYTNMLGLDSAQPFSKTHKESALAQLEAFNDYQKSGLWPTAHDEARLAASMAYSLRKAGVEDAVTEPLVAWSLRRNGALYEAWELAAEYPIGGSLDAAGQPNRSDLASHQWYNTLSLLQLRLGSFKSAIHAAAADQFAKEHLLARERWVAYPQLHQALVNTLCGALSNSTLKFLGDAGKQCVLLQSLAEGLGWAEAEEVMGMNEVGKGNGLSDTFQSHWEVVATLAVSGEQRENAKALVEHLLELLSVGYINERSETFWAAHGRMLLRGPYAHVLQLAAVLLPEARREELLTSTRAILENPQNHSDRLMSHPEDMKETFLQWLSSHWNSSSHGFPGYAVSDGVDGYDPDDGANPEVMLQMQLDKDMEMELGFDLYEDSEGFERFDTHALLATLLNLHSPDASSSGEFEAAGGDDGDEEEPEAAALVEGGEPEPTEACSYPTYDVQKSGGQAFTVDGNTVTSTGKYASVLYSLAGRSGALYLELTRADAGTKNGYGNGVGVQRAPTRVGNYHSGTGRKGNGGQGVAFYTELLSGSEVNSLLIDLDASTVSLNGGQAEAIPGSGDLYLAFYDGSSRGSGWVTFNWGQSAFTHTVPTGASPWCQNPATASPMPAPTSGPTATPTPAPTSGPTATPTTTLTSPAAVTTAAPTPDPAAATTPAPTSGPSPAAEQGCSYPGYDTQRSGGEAFAVNGNTVKSFGKYASVLYSLAGRSGKLYIEFTRDGGGVGVQRTPTRVGNYHGGMGGNGNKGKGVAFSSQLYSGSEVNSLLIDLDASMVSLNGGQAKQIPGSGDLYLAFYDGSARSTGWATINWGQSPFAHTVPTGASPWCQAPTMAPTPAPTPQPMSATQAELLKYCVADHLAR